LRATVSVCAVLALSFVVTAFVSSAYRRERETLGRRHYDQGQRLQSNGNVRGAIEEYREALLYSPDNTYYRLSLATSLLNAGRLNEAQSHLEQLAEEDPTNGVINLMLARVAVKRDKLSAAVESYQRAVYEYWPSSEASERRQARWELSELLRRTGNRSGYIGELMQLYANVPSTDPHEASKIGFLLLSAGATSEASEVFHDLIKSAPRNADGYRGLGTVQFNTGDYVSARHDFQRAIRVSPSDRDSAQLLALTNQVIDIDPALPHITSAERLRRSQNLLSRVTHELEACFVPPKINAPQPTGPVPSNQSSNATTAAPATPPDPLTQRLNDAEKLLKEPGQNSSDRNLEMQDTAQQLWNDRAQFCPSKSLGDKAVEAVLPRIGRE